MVGTIRDQENETDIERERGRARDTGIQGYRDTEIQRCIELVRAIVWDKVAHV